MAELKDFSLTHIDWNMTPEQAVSMYLEWGHNDFDGQYPPVRSKDDYSTYFVVDSWDNPPSIRLVRRNSENAEDLFIMPMPEELMEGWREANGSARGVNAITPEVKAWLKEKLGQENIDS